MQFVPTPDAVEVRRSRRRTRTVTAWREGGVTVVSIPARFTRAQEREWVDRMLGRLAAHEERRRPSDDVLFRRAAELSREYLGGRAVPASVSWSSRQGRRWGSCTTIDGTIRISDRLQGMPRWVLDYVLVHELAHLLHPGHDARFWGAVARYPLTERARGFLDGYAHAVGRGQAGPDDAWDDEPAADEAATDEAASGEVVVRETETGVAGTGVAGTGESGTGVADEPIGAVAAHAPGGRDEVAAGGRGALDEVAADERRTTGEVAVLFDVPAALRRGRRRG